MQEDRRIEIRLFGAIEVRDGRGAIALPSRRGSWLLAILALRRGSPIERQALATTVWPESTDQSALHNLRQTLAGVRRALGPAGDEIEAVSPRSIVLRTRPATWIDALEFDDAIRKGGIEDLERAAELYRDRLLTDCDEPFAMLEREPRERLFLDVANRLGEHHLLQGDPVRAARIYRRAIDVDPYRECATRGLMECLAQSGENAAALDTYRRFAQKLRRDVRSEPNPETKSLARAIRSGTETPSRAAPAGETGARPIPKPLTPLIGREREVGEVVTLLDRCRLVTLAGVGGVGKTRLALAVAEEIEERSLERATFVDLASVGDPRMVHAAIASALGMADKSDVPSVDSIGEWLRRRPGLIVLDNCEHLAEAVAHTLEALLAASHQIQVLATSRQPIGVAGEMVWRVPSLATPGPRDGSESLLRSPAVRLFLQRAKSAGGPELEHEDEIGTIGAICRRLDGIPLAIELAAARTNLLSPREIERRLDDRFTLLSGGSRSVPRHQTLRAAVEWSWDLLDPSDRELLERLSVFRGGATLEGVEALWGRSALDMLSHLVDRSLVLSAPGADGSRFSMLETIRQFASERLEARGSGEAARLLHGEHFLRRAEEASAHFHSPDEVRWFESLERDHDNLRAALAWFLSSGRIEDALRLSICMCRFWDTHGHLTEGRGLLERTLVLSSGLPAALVADAHGRAGWMATVQRDVPCARAHYDYALGYFRGAGDRFRTAIGLTCLAGTNYYAGDCLTAQAQYGEALALFRELGMAGNAAAVLSNQGEVALKMNDPEAARAYLLESVAEGGGSEAGSPQRSALTLANLAVADLRQGRTEVARERAIRSLRLFHEAQVLVSISDGLGLLAVVEGASGAWERAARLLGAEREIALAQGLPIQALIAPERERTEAGAREALGAEGFLVCYGLGRAMSPEEGVAFALAV